MPEDLAAVRDELAARYRILKDDAEVQLTGTDVETLSRQAQRLQERTRRA